MKRLTICGHFALMFSIALVARGADAVKVTVKDSASFEPVQADVMVLGKAPGKISEIVSKGTDASGSLDVDLTGLSRVTVLVRAPGYGVRCLTGDQLKSSAIDVTLPRAIRLAGAVRDSGGKELPYATIKVVHPDHAACAIRLTYFEEERTSGSTGRYVSNEIDAGSEFFLIIQRAGFTERRITRAEIPLTSVAKVGGVQEFDVILQPGK